MAHIGAVWFQIATPVAPCALEIAAHGRPGIQPALEFLIEITSGKQTETVLVRIGACGTGLVETAGRQRDARHRLTQPACFIECGGWIPRQRMGIAVFPRRLRADFVDV